MHCVQDVHNGFHASDHTDKSQWFQNFEDYLGSRVNDFVGNSKCPGGQFMDATDIAGSYVSQSGKPDFWNYGAEVWCNQSG